MSATAQRVAPAPLSPLPVRVREKGNDDPSRPAVRVAAFGALGLYGALRWSTLLEPHQAGRLLGLLALSMGLILAGPLLARSRWVGAPAGFLAVLVTFPMSGVPLDLVVHLRIARIIAGIDQGLAALPRVLVPYSGVDDWIRVVVVLGAGVLMVSAAGLLLALAPDGRGEARRAVAAVPLIALATVPSILIHPKLPYVQGLILFALLALLMWGERVRAGRVPAAVAACLVAVFAAMMLAPALEQHQPWVDYEALAGTFAPGQVDAFDWSQGYGPLNWPRTGHEVFDVKATRGDYWKTENLDLFNGKGWESSPVVTGQELVGPDQETVARFTQTITVTIKGMTSSDVIASGFAALPGHLPGVVLTGASPGTWTTGSELGPGDTYTVTTYSPHPSATELQVAGAIPYQDILEPYLELVLPQPAGESPQEVAFPPFHSQGPPADLTLPLSEGAAPVIEASPYRRAYALAQRLAAQSATPYVFVSNVQDYLSRGYRYDETPRTARYPLDDFLFSTKLGYCQQFAGAMALLLRMGGVPARVAVGFTSGSYDSSDQSWVVSDIDAHAWVEAWFPGYGWVTFDPTPSSDPARGGHVAALPAGTRGSNAAKATPAVPRRQGAAIPAVRTAAPAAHAHASSPAAEIIGLLVLLLLLAGGHALSTRRERSVDALLAELERAFRRTGRPISGGLTLAALAERLAASPQAADYVHTLALNRFAGDPRTPTLASRRALRGELAAGLGLVGKARALWALPPKWQPRGRPRPDGGDGPSR